MFILLLTHPERYLLIYFSAVSAGRGLTFRLCVYVCVFKSFNLNLHLFDSACNSSQSHKEALEKNEFSPLMSKLKANVMWGEKKTLVISGRNFQMISDPKIGCQTSLVSIRFKEL